jgi:hypothetical protein
MSSHPRDIEDDEIAMAIEAVTSGSTKEYHLYGRDAVVLRCCTCDKISTVSGKERAVYGKSPVRLCADCARRFMK